MRERDQARAREIGQRVAEARREAGMTQRELADLLNVSERSMQGYEIGEVPPFKYLHEIGRILQKDVSWLLHGVSDSPSVDVSQLLESLSTLTDEVERIRKLLERQQPPK